MRLGSRSSTGAVACAAASGEGWAAVRGAAAGCGGLHASEARPAKEPSKAAAAAADAAAAAAAAAQPKQQQQALAAK